MNRQHGVFVLVWLLATASAGLCLTDRDIVRLKQGGFADETVAAVVQSRAVETGAFTVAGLVGLKRAGVSEETIRTLVEAHPFARVPGPVVYGEVFLKRRPPTVEEIIALKKAGVSDAVVEALVRRPETESQRLDRQRAWRMLDNMQIELGR